MSANYRSQRWQMPNESQKLLGAQRRVTLWETSWNTWNSDRLRVNQAEL